jgi:ribose transport system ATP-binding protein
MLEMVNISKSFFGVQALRNVTLKASPGKVLALIGINGAGKTTLMNILGGNVKNDSGKIVLDGKEIIINNPQDAEKSGIAFIHQEPLFFLSLTVAENIFVTNLVNSNIPCFIGMKKMISMSEKYLNILGSDQIDPMSKMENISIGERQIVEIARSFVFGAKIIIFDEPTSSLSQNEKKSLFEVIDKMKAEGKIIIYISHLLDEIKEICDEYLVLRDGNMAGSGSIADVEKSDLTRMIVGKDIGISQKPLKQNQTDKKVILSVKNFQRSNVLYDISFDLIQGEILGIWGLMGSGRTELVRALLGFDKLDAGEVYLFYKDKLQKIENSKLLRYCGYVTEDRHTDGLFFGMNITRNNTSASLSKYTYRFFQFMNTKKEERDAEKYIHELNIKTPGTSTNI